MSYNINEWLDWITSCVLRLKNGQCPIDDKFQCSLKDMTCPFHLTDEQKAQSDANWNRRMSALPQGMQDHIAEVYFKGNKPWLKTETE